MATNPFEILLEELQEALGTEPLKADESNTCLISFPEGLNVQIEPFPGDDKLLIISPLAELPLGPYRKEVAIEALKANGLPPPRHGVFAFSQDTNELFLQKIFPLQDLTGDVLGVYIESFIKKALQWKEYLDRGDIPLAETLSASGASVKRPSGMFGM